MKTKSCFVCLSAALALFAGRNAQAAVAFTVTPSAVSNTFRGTISLQITGLTNTETVVVQKFVDLNTNGVIDGADTLVQQFTLQDGVISVIGGVTNLNVPGDLNSATGAITAVLNFQNGDFVQNLVAKYLYKVSSPTGRFAPITNSFNVTNFPFAQKFTGNVVSNSTSTTLSNSIVLLFGPPRIGHGGPGNPLAGCIANNSGSYTVMVPPGIYTLVAFRSNYVSSFVNPPVLTLGSGQTVTTNLSIISATNSITGKIVDAANNAIGLPGVFMPAQSTNNQIAIAFTDTNGNFTMRVIASQWQLGSDSEGLLVHGYLGLNNGITTNSGATNVILAFPKADALFYGSVKDNLGNPLAGIGMGASDTSSNIFQTSGYTDTNGNYFVGILGLGSNDPWQVGVSSDTAPTNYVFSQPQLDQMNGTNVAVGQALEMDFTAILATNRIVGSVKNNTNAIISGVGVYASANIAGTNYDNYTQTDTNGNYSMNVANGQWDVNLNCSGGNDSLGQFGNYICPNSQVATIAGNNSTNNFIVQYCGGVVITTSSPLPVGEVNVFYNQAIQASDCSGVYNWSQTGGALPGNMNLSPGGNSYVLSGFPTSSGTFVFTVQVNDGAGGTTNGQFTVSISNRVQVTTTTLPGGTNGAPYGQQLQASGGVPFPVGQPYNWSISSGSPPANLTLAVNGSLSGSLATNGSFNFSVRATDSLGGFFDQPLSLTVASTNVFPPLTIGTGGGQIIVFWPASAGTNFILQTTTNVATGPWVPATNGMPAVSFVFSNTSPVQFFRLH
jgi:hypothetical protein